MPLEESLYPQDWFAKARQDIRTVEILLREEGDTEVAGFHLQQAVEKYLKGYCFTGDGNFNAFTIWKYYLMKRFAMSQSWINFGSFVRQPPIFTRWSDTLFSPAPA
jgi:hypothetical protein